MKNALFGIGKFLDCNFKCELMKSQNVSKSVVLVLLVIIKEGMRIAPYALDPNIKQFLCRFGQLVLAAGIN